MAYWHPIKINYCEPVLGEEAVHLLDPFGIQV